MVSQHHLQHFLLIMYIGYGRVSTEDQNLAIQLQALEQAGCQRIFQEKLSGAHRQRPELTRMLEQLREGDAVVIWKLDRLARSTRDLLDIADTIAKAGAGLKSLSEPWADTTSPAGRMVLTVFAGIAEFERALIIERTGTGRSAAMKRGVRFGRPASLSLDQAALAKRLLEEGKSAKDVAKTFGVNRSTIYRALVAA
jgi:DNA invertase Pin-like site-specific DNA recombinase